MRTQSNEQLEAALAALSEDVKAVRRELAALQQRVHRLEVREEWIQDPGASGDEAIPS